MRLAVQECIRAPRATRRAAFAYAQAVGESSEKAAATFARVAGSRGNLADWPLDVRAAQKQADNAIQTIEAAMMGMAQDMMRDFGLRGYRPTWRRNGFQRAARQCGRQLDRSKGDPRRHDTPGLSSSQGGRLFFPVLSATISFFRPRFGENMR